MNQPAKTSKFRSRHLTLWLAVLAWAALIFFFSAQPSLTTHWDVVDTILRKFAHAAEFGILCLLVWGAIRQHGASSSRALSAGAALSLLYAFSDELHQHFVPGRSATIRDVGFDFAGIVIAMAAVAIYGKKHSAAETDAPVN